MLREQALASDLCGIGHESGTSEGEGLSQQPLSEQAQGSALSGSSPKQATFVGAGLKDLQVYRVISGNTE